MAISGWVWRECADWQSINRWENEGGAYDGFTGDALERYQIIRAGFNHWFDPWLKQLVFPHGHPGYIGGWCMGITYFAAYRAGLKGEPHWPRPTWWLHADQNQLVQQRMHDAYMVGVTDEQTRAELAKLGFLP